MKRGKTLIIEQDQHLQNLRKIIKRDFLANQEKHDPAPKMNLNSYLSGFTSKQNKLFAEMVHTDKQQWKQKHWWIDKQDKIKMITSAESTGNQYRNMIEGDKDRNGINTNIINQQAKNAIFFKQDSGYSSYLSDTHEEAKKIIYNNCRLGSNQSQQVKYEATVEEGNKKAQQPILMTWGQIQNTPLRISGPQYRIQETPIREEVLYKLNQNINRKKVQKDKRKNQMVSKLIGSVTPSSKKSSYRVPSSSMRRVNNSEKRNGKNQADIAMSGLLDINKNSK